MAAFYVVVRDTGCTDEGEKAVPRVVWQTTGYREFTNEANARREGERAAMKAPIPADRTEVTVFPLAESLPPL